MGSDGSDAECTRGVPRLIGLADCWDVSLEIQGMKIEVVIGGGGLGGGGAVANEGVYSESGG